MTTYEAIIAMIKEDVRCDVHGNICGYESTAEHLAEYIDRYVARIEQLEAALHKIASCESHHPDDVVAVARAALAEEKAE